MNPNNIIQNEIISLLKKTNGLSTSEIVKKCSFSSESIKNELNNLRSLNLIKSSGETWQRIWLLIN